ncbi:unnamed protein product [Rangifer tarandus platyrhynchus]|uniref:Uncharacterized protein n=2 Tax=Rangifer tarandus platyrhynchus TaxID=3082113 RepID=A0ACB0E4H9_RANTA|nr:unnamed protein product [Rangifer tarandus platyrhynchus]CAI9695386.1 unnamed protein product [Rangifer tarandus platyrhynchus]
MASYPQLSRARSPFGSVSARGPEGDPECKRKCSRCHLSSAPNTRSPGPQRSRSAAVFAQPGKGPALPPPLPARSSLRCRLRPPGSGIRPALPPWCAPRRRRRLSLLFPPLRRPRPGSRFAGDAARAPSGPGENRGARARACATDPPLLLPARARAPSWLRAGAAWRAGGEVAGVLAGGAHLFASVPPRR